MRFGYTFRYVQLNRSLFRRSQMCEYHPTWGKVFYIRERLRQLHEQGDRCTWLLFVDSDAFVRETDLPIPNFLLSLASRYNIQSSVGAIFAQNRDIHRPVQVYVGPIAGFKAHVQWVNAGVFFVQSNARSRRLFDTWQFLGERSENPLHRSWPGETGVITELVRPGLYPYARTAEWGVANLTKEVALVDMVEMDSPWGRFVAHIWGFHWYRREIDYWDHLIRIRADETHYLAYLLRKVLRTRTYWGPEVATGTWIHSCRREQWSWRDKFWGSYRRARSGAAPCEDHRCDVRSAAQG